MTFPDTTEEKTEPDHHHLPSQPDSQQQMTDVPTLAPAGEGLSSDRVQEDPGVDAHRADESGVSTPKPKPKLFKSRQG